MEKYLNKQVDYGKQFFPFEFDSTLSEDPLALNSFYLKIFNTIEAQRQNQRFIHYEYPNHLQKKDVKTGCLISCFLSSGLQQILSNLKCTVSHRSKIGRVNKLKQFCFQDGKVKNTQIIARAVKKFSENDNHKNVQKDSFILVHFFTAQQGANKPEEAQNPKSQQFKQDTLLLNNLKPDPIIPFSKVKQEKQSVFRTNNDKIKSEDEQKQNPSYQRHINNQTSVQLNKNQNQYQQNNRNQQEQNSIVQAQNQSIQQGNFNAKNSIKQEFLELDGENQKLILQQESNYFKRLYEAEKEEKIQLGIQYHTLKLEILKKQISKKKINKSENEIINLEVD